MTCFRRVGSQLVIRVCPQTNENLRVVKRKLYRKIFRRIALESCPTVHVEGCPMTVSESCPTIYLGGLSNKISSEIYNVFSRTKTFCFENSVFSHLAYACARELVRTRGMGLGM